MFSRLYRSFLGVFFVLASAHALITSAHAGFSTQNELNQPNYDISSGSFTVLGTRFPKLNVQDFSDFQSNSAIPGTYAKLRRSRRLSDEPVNLPELQGGLFATYNLKRQTGCLAVALYFEARGEHFPGQVAVGQVILNRVESSKYPNTICQVVYQNAQWKNRCQFSFACDGKVESPGEMRAWQNAIQTAQVLTGNSVISSYVKKVLLNSLLSPELERSTHYHANYVQPGWSKRLTRAGEVGQHIFYISDRAWR